MSDVVPDPWRGLRDHWLPLRWSRAVGETPSCARLLGEPVLVSRSRAHGLRVTPARAWRSSARSGERGERGERYLAEERDGVVWCSLGRPSAPPPAWPYRDWPGTSGSAELECSFVRLIENMMDASHAAFIHGGLLRGKPTRLVRYVVRDTVAGVQKINERERARGSLLYRLFGSGEDEFCHVEELVLPCWVRAEYQTTGGEVVFAVQFAFAPVTATRTRILYRVGARRAISRVGPINRVALLVLGRLVRRVIEQDRWILEAEERVLEELRGRGEAPRRAATSADIAAVWAGQRAEDLAAGRARDPAAPARRVEFELRL
ncbi:MAG: hypothetical protein R3B48_02080 [Kofleriaceae bacterium]